MNSMSKTINYYYYYYSWQILSPKTVFEDFPCYIPIVKSESLGRAFQMSYIDSENCSEHLMTIGMGLDRAVP